MVIMLLKSVCSGVVLTKAVKPKCKSISVARNGEMVGADGPYSPRFGCLVTA